MSKIREKEIKSPAQICDFLMEKRRRGIDRVVWRNPTAFNAFWKFVLTSWPTEFGYRLPDVDEFNGQMFMGLKHFIHLREK